MHPMVMPIIAYEYDKTLAGGAETEGGRRPTVVSTPPAASPELTDRPRRRTFKAADKLRILRQVDEAQPGSIGAILRREGLYSSLLTDWRRQRDAGAYEALKTIRAAPRLRRPIPWRPNTPSCCATTIASRCACNAPRRSSKSKKKWLCCWVCRSPATSHPNGRRGCPAARRRSHGRGLRGAGSVARQLSSPADGGATSAGVLPSAPQARAGAGRERATGRPRPTARTPVRRPSPRGSLCRTAGPRPLSLLDPHHVPDPPRERRGEGAPPATAPSDLQKA